MRKILTLLFVFYSLIFYAQRGKDGAMVIGLPNTMINEFSNLTVDAIAGSSLITVANSSLNTNGRFPSSLSPGDLIMIIQMQGATIKTGVNDSTWGEVTNYNNCGLYEFKEVLSVPDSITITFCPLQNNYTAKGKTQVVRIPRYTSLAVNAGGELTTMSWDGIIGGIVNIEVLNTITVNAGGSINASGKGFRGGVTENDATFGIHAFFSQSSADGAEKGEGIAGYQADYDSMGGRYCRGAPANGGGGGNAHNSAGGGGGNAGNIANYSGNGNPDISDTSWVKVWNLEYNGFANSTSSGGGRGGYSYANAYSDVYTIPPGSAAWAGDNRRNVGGKGGWPLNYSTGRLFLGGGGGAGDMNDLNGGAGARGGGLIYLRAYGNINGAGDVVSNGDSAPASTGEGIDALGGGGAGGTITVSAAGTISGIRAIANGGNGGNQIVTRDEAEGPGGGGGGGYIAASNGAFSLSVASGKNGITDSRILSGKFPPNGATQGGDGLTAAVSNYTFQTVNDTVCIGSSAVLRITTNGTVSSGTSYIWYNSPTGGSIVGTGIVFTTPPLTSTTVYYVAPCPGTYRLPDTAFVVPLPVITVNSLSICPGQNGTLNASGAINYTWNTGAITPAITVNAPVTATYTVTGKNIYGCINTTNATVTVYPEIVPILTSAVICEGEGAILMASGAGTSGTYTWSDGTTGAFLMISPTITTTYTLSAIDMNGCIGTSVTIVTVNPKPFITSTSWAICIGESVTIIANGAGPSGTYTWSNGLSGASISVSPITATTYTVIGSTQAGCTNRATVLVTVSVSSSVKVNTAHICSGQPAVLSASGASSYSWSTGATTQTITVNPIVATTYTVIASTQTGCTGSATAIVTVDPKPIVAFGKNTAACSPLTVQFINNSTSTLQSLCAWKFGDGSTSANCNPSHTYPIPGVYSVTLIVTTQAGCIDSFSIPNMIRVYPHPKAGFTAAPWETEILNPKIKFTNTSYADSIRDWNFGDGITDSVKDPTHIYKDAGHYNVCLRIQNTYGCSDSVCQIVIITPLWTYFIPNAFSPNGDGKNDRFNGMGENIHNYKLFVFDRWGNQIFESNSLSIDWDGTANFGKDIAQEDVYVYVVSFKDIFDKKHQYKGSVTLVR